MGEQNKKTDEDQVEEEALKAFANRAYEVLREVVAEAYTEGVANGAYSSAHEAFADLLQSVDEIKAHVWALPSQRDLIVMERDFQKLASKALRSILDVCRGGDLPFNPEGKEREA